MTGQRAGEANCIVSAALVGCRRQSMLNEA
jgi:hypothetical protein